MGSFSGTSPASFIFIWGVSLTYSTLALHFFRGEFLLHITGGLFFFFLILWSVCYTSHVGFIFLWGVSLKIPCWLHFYVGSLSCTSHADFFFIFFSSGEFLLHIPCWLHFYAWSFSYTFRALLFFIQGVFLTHPMLASFLIFLLIIIIIFIFLFFLIWGFLLHIACSFPFYIGWVSLTHTVLASCLSREFLLHLPYRLKFHGGSSSYTSHAGFTFL